MLITQNEHPAGFNSGINGTYKVFGLLNDRPAYLCGEKRKLLWWDGKDWKVAKPDPQKMVNRACYAHCHENVHFAHLIDPSKDWRVKTHHDHGEWEKDTNIIISINHMDLYIFHSLQRSKLVLLLGVPDVILLSIIRFVYKAEDHGLSPSFSIPRQISSSPVPFEENVPTPPIRPIPALSSENEEKTKKKRRSRKRKKSKKNKKKSKARHARNSSVRSLENVSSQPPSALAYSAYNRQTPLKVETGGKQVNMSSVAVIHVTGAGNFHS